MKDTPVVVQPPPLSNSVNTIAAVFRGAKVHKVIVIAKRPKICMNKTNPSTRGSFLAKYELKRIENVATAIHKSVP